MSHQKGYVDPDYLDTVARAVSDYMQRTYELMGTQPGHVVGVDSDASMVAEADKRAEEAGVTAWVEHRRADATALPFEARSFDAVRSERVFQHLQDSRL